jgi:hypothetical protein
MPSGKLARPITLRTGSPLLKHHAAISTPHPSGSNWDITSPFEVASQPVPDPIVTTLVGVGFAALFAFRVVRSMLTDPAND